jgi:hypothetical protein
MPPRLRIPRNVRFALSGVGRDGVAANKLAVMFGQHPTVIQRNAAVRMNFLHRHQFAIGEFAAVLGFGIGLELQPVSVDRESSFGWQT